MRLRSFQRLAKVNRFRDRLSTVVSELAKANLVGEQPVKLALTRLGASLNHLDRSGKIPGVALSWSDLAMVFSGIITRTNDVERVVSRTIMQAITLSEPPVWLRNWPQEVKEQLSLPELARGISLLIRLIQDPESNNLTPAMVKTFVKGDRGANTNYKFYRKHHDQISNDAIMQAFLKSTYPTDELEEILKLLEPVKIKNESLVKSLTKTRRDINWLIAAICSNQKYSWEKSR